MKGTMEDFPPNSKKMKTGAAEPKKIERVTSVEAVQRRRPLGKRFAHTFFGGDARTAVNYMIGNVLIPAAKEALVEAASSGFEKLVYGEAKPRNRGMPQGYGPKINYSRMGQASQAEPPMTTGLSKAGRARHNFGELLIQQRQEAEDVINRMYDILDKYEVVMVSDLYSLVGLTATHVDHKWGWIELKGAQVGRARGGGYVLDLPEPQPLGR